MFKKATPEMIALLRRTGSNDIDVARAAMRAVAAALTIPLRQGILRGDIISGIFTEVPFEPGVAPEFPTDFIAPGAEKNITAYTVPNTGRIKENNVEGDYVMVPTYDTGASIDWPLKYQRDARWDIQERAMEYIRAAHTRKNNDDGFHTLLAAGLARNLIPYDDQATAGLFSKRVIALMQTIMRRNAGGNSTSVNRGQLTDLYLSPESVQDIRSWDLTQIDEFTRREIFLAGSNGDDAAPTLTKIFGVVLHDIDELGVAQEYELYYENTLGGTLPSDKKEVLVGLDLKNRNSFVRPVRQEIEMFEDMYLHRQNRAGMYSREEGGFGCLLSTRVLLGAA